MNDKNLSAASSYQKDAVLGTLVRDAERVARANPAVVLGGTFLIGLAAGRILKTPSKGVDLDVDEEPARALAAENPAPEPEPLNGPSTRSGRSPSGKAAKAAEARR
jgi:hypothetical protein